MKYFALFPALGMALLAGCSAGSDAMQKQLDEMKHEVERVHAGNLALQDRVDALEEQAVREGGARRRTRQRGGG